MIARDAKNTIPTAFASSTVGRKSATLGCSIHAVAAHDPSDAGTGSTQTRTRAIAYFAAASFGAASATGCQWRARVLIDSAPKSPTQYAEGFGS